VNDYNAQFPLEINRILKSIGSKYMQFTPIVERLATDLPENAMHLLPNDLTLLRSSDPALFRSYALPLLRSSDPALFRSSDPAFLRSYVLTLLRSYALTLLRSQLAPWSVKPLDYGRFLCEIFDDWVLHDVGTYFVPTFDSILANWVGSITSICVHAETCGHAGVIEHNGDVFACDHYVFPEYRLGNIYTDSLVSMMYSPRQIEFGQAKRNALPQYCRECEYLFACNGECPKNRIIQTPTGEAGLNYLCSGLRLFYAHVAPYMDFMAEELANERPPANVMAWARERIKSKPLVKSAPAVKPVTRMSVKPNDPCPCGSGKKYKQCCRNKPMTDF
jgi:uncharacterized protein